MSTHVNTLGHVDIEQAARNLEQALVEYERAFEGEGSLLTGWVVIAEFLTREGTPHLSSYAARGLPYWRIDGMIDAARDAIGYVDPIDLEIDDE